jgi:hypothetical protein
VFRILFIGNYCELQIIDIFEHVAKCRPQQCNVSVDQVVDALVGLMFLHTMAIN